MPGVFTAGQDVDDLRTYFEAATFGDSPLRFIKTLATLDKPMIAAVDGLAMGIGTTMLFHCDFVVASEWSVFSSPCAGLGMPPEAGSSLLAPNIMGYHLAFELMVMGEQFDAQRALMAGLINRIVVPEDLEPVALSYAGTTHAVMMATPSDLEDFAIGFSLTEGVIASAEEIEDVAVEEAGAGIDIQIRLKDEANHRFEARRRRLAGPVGCGLCGIESIDEAMRSAASVAGAELLLSSTEISNAVRLLTKQQPMHAETGAVHAAGFYVPGEGIVAAREDVGRHNALDKLAGALARSGTSGATGIVVITSRVSVEMVQKAAQLGTGMIVAVSAPTALAIRTAEEAGMTLVALVRGDEFDIFTRPDRIQAGASADVA